MVRFCIGKPEKKHPSLSIAFTFFKKAWYCRIATVDSYDVTITGPNSTMVSGQLSTKLTGRYIEFPIYPLSLREFRDFFPEFSDNEKLFDNYLQYGGLPGLRILNKLRDETVLPFLRSIHDTLDGWIRSCFIKHIALTLKAKGSLKSTTSIMLPTSACVIRRSVTEAAISLICWRILSIWSSFAVMIRYTPVKWANGS